MKNSILRLNSKRDIMSMTKLTLNNYHKVFLSKLHKIRQISQNKHKIWDHVPKSLNKNYQKRMSMNRLNHKILRRLNKSWMNKKS